MNVWNYLLPKFPFQIGLNGKRVLVEDKYEFIEIFKKWNGKKRIYYSLYSYPFEQTIVDKLFFDFDGLNSWNEIKRLHEKLLKDNIQHTVIFSGGGFHLYIFTQPRLSHKLELKQTQMMLIQKYQMKGYDQVVIGDISRLAGLPYTYNLKRKKFVIPLIEEDFEKDINEILEKATKIHKEFQIFGNKKIELINAPIINTKNIQQPKLEWKYEGDDKFIRQLPPCIQRVFTSYDYGDYRGRFFATVFLKDLGLSKEEIDKIFKKYFGNQKPKSGRGPTRYDEWKRHKILDYVFEKDYTFPNCQTIQNEGYCPGICEYFEIFGKKLEKFEY